MLLFDEPLTGLDPIGIRRMRDTIVAPRRRRAPPSSCRRTCCIWSRRCARASSSWTAAARWPTARVAELATRADLAGAGSKLEQIFLSVTGRDRLPAARLSDVRRDALHHRLFGAEPAAPTAAATARAAVLVGAIVGVAYLYFSRVRADARFERRARGATAPIPIAVLPLARRAAWCSAGSLSAPARP